MEVEGQFPLVLPLSGGFRPSGQEVQELHAGRIPERCLDGLGEAATSRVFGTRLSWAFLLLFVLRAVKSILDGPPGGGDGEPSSLGFVHWLVLDRFVPFILLLRILVGSAPGRDVRERRLRTEEGELTRKCMRTTTRSRWAPNVAQHSASFLKRLSADLAAFLRDEEPQRCDNCLVDVLWVRIGRRTLEIESRVLFNQLGTGVRYRMYLSRRARRLIAIESVDRPVERGVFAGYRTAPGTGGTHHERAR
jgi:hypothetical protein